MFSALCKSAEPLSISAYSAVWTAGPVYTAALLPAVPAYHQGGAVLLVVWTPAQPEAHAVLWHGHP